MSNLQVSPITTQSVQPGPEPQQDNSANAHLRERINLILEKLHNVRRSVGHPEEEKIKKIKSYPGRAIDFQNRLFFCSLRVKSIGEKILKNVESSSTESNEILDDCEREIEQIQSEVEGYFQQCRLHINILASHKKENEECLQKFEDMERGLTQLEQDSLYKKYVKSHSGWKGFFYVLDKINPSREKETVSNVFSSKTVLIQTEEDYKQFYDPWKSGLQKLENVLEEVQQHFQAVHKCIELGLGSEDDLSLLSLEKVGGCDTKASSLLAHHECCIDIQRDLETIKTDIDCQAFKGNEIYRQEIKDLTEQFKEFSSFAIESIKSPSDKLKYDNAIKGLKFRINNLKQYCKVALQGLLSGAWTLDKFSLNRSGQRYLVRKMTQSAVDEVVKLENMLKQKISSITKLSCMAKKCIDDITTAINNMTSDDRSFSNSNDCEREDQLMPLYDIEKRESELNKTKSLIFMVDHMDTEINLISQEKDRSPLLEELLSFYTSESLTDIDVEQFERIYRDFEAFIQDENIASLFSENEKLEQMKKVIYCDYSTIKSSLDPQQTMNQLRKDIFQLILLCRAVKRDPELYRT